MAVVNYTYTFCGTFTHMQLAVKKIRVSTWIRTMVAPFKFSDSTSVHLLAK